VSREASLLDILAKRKITAPVGKLIPFVKPVTSHTASEKYLCGVLKQRRSVGTVHMLHPIRENAHFMNWPYYSCPFHELAFTLAQFTNWAILSLCMLRLRLGCWPLHIFMLMMCKIGHYK
jgi:hypothetical protein